MKVKNKHKCCTNTSSSNTGKVVSSETVIVIPRRGFNTNPSAPLDEINLAFVTPYTSEENALIVIRVWLFKTVQCLLELAPSIAIWKNASMALRVN
jgi:hypothetical protein